MLSIQVAPTGAASHPLLLAVFALLILTVLFVLRLYASRLRAALLPERLGRTEDSFVHHMAGIGINPRIARTTYRYLQRTHGIHFAIQTGDSLREDLGLDSRAIREALRALLIENERVIIANYQRSAIVTVGDLVGLVQCSPRVDVGLAA